MGRHGVGKNTVGNAILKKKAFTFHDCSKNYYVKDENMTFDRYVSVTRVPGWTADLNSEKNGKLWQVIKDSVRSVPDGPHAIILVVDMHTEPTEATKEKLKHLLGGDQVLQHILIISVDARKILVNHSDRKQTIIDRCKFHFWSCTCAKQNRKLIETIEDFIVYKHDLRFYSTGKKTTNPEVQLQDLTNLVERLKCKISALSDSLDSKNAEIRELQRLLNEKEDKLRATLDSNQDQQCLSTLNRKIEQLEHAQKQSEKGKQKMKEQFQRREGQMKKELQEKTEEIKKLKLENTQEIEKLRKVIQALESQNGNKKRSKPSKLQLSQKGDDESMELIPVTSAGMMPNNAYIILI